MYAFVQWKEKAAFRQNVGWVGGTKTSHKETCFPPALPWRHWTQNGGHVWHKVQMFFVSVCWCCLKAMHSLQREVSKPTKPQNTKRGKDSRKQTEQTQFAERTSVPQNPYTQGSCKLEYIEYKRDRVEERRTACEEGDRVSTRSCSPLLFSAWGNKVLSASWVATYFPKH